MAELDTILKEVEGLSYAEQRELVAQLQRRHLALLTNRFSPMVTARETKASERWHQLRTILRDVTDEDITDRSRKRPVITARWCAVTQMRLDGYTGMEIERATGWDHSTICNIDRRVGYAMDYPSLYPDFVNVWNRMQRRLAV